MVSLQFLPEELQLTQNFKDDLQRALAAETDDLKRSKLNNLFNLYGHVFQTEVDLGGMCVTTSSIVTSTEA